MTKQIGLIASILLISSSAHAVCRILVDSKFASNLPIAGIDLSFKDEIKQSLTKTEKEFIVVPDTMLKDREVVAGCNPYITKVACENTEYDYKLSIQQNLTVSPKNYAAEMIDNRIQIKPHSTLTIVELKTDWKLTNGLGQEVIGKHVSLQGSPDFVQRVEEGESLSTKLSAVTQHSKEAIADYLMAFPSCDELTSFNLKKY